MDAAVFKVQQTLGAIAANVRTEIGKWEERNDAASNALSRLEGILERSAAVRAAGIPEATKLGTRSARHAVQPTPTAAAGAGAGSGTGSSTGGVQVDDESKSSKVQVQVQGGWGKLSAIKGLPLALARALAKDTERWAKAVTTEMDALVQTEAAISTLCSKAAKSYRRHAATLGLSNAASGTATSISIVAFLESFRVIENMYGEQLDLKIELVHPSKLGDLESVTAAIARWDSIVNPKAAELRDMLFAMTAVTTAVPPASASTTASTGGGGSAKKKKKK
eukprot:gene12996-24580_t